MSRSNRKLDHVRLALKSPHTAKTHFDDVHFIHRSFPEVNRDECSLYAGSIHLPLQSPVFINAMTGGAKETMDINRNLAIAARETGIALAVGSQRAALDNPDLVATYRVVRDEYPGGVIMANLGAGCTVDDALRAVDMLQANVLQLHVNAPQEIVMPEGDRDFKGLLHSVESVVKAVSVPVIVKEVGFGMSRETYDTLRGIGVQYVDVGGNGGTNFIQIEDERRAHSSYSYLNRWGQSTVISLLEAQPVLRDMNVVASGGIRNPLDVLRCLSLGAKAVGIAGVFLRILQHSGTEQLIKTILDWHDQMTSIMTLLGARSIEELTHVPVAVTGFPYEWCQARQIGLDQLAGRRP